ncbi:hypothetical protein ElyMa_005354700 [Elysia marginata]|uniref:Uncharacterized protein n=1 Tax=Elysia marginata TaxID=1093978 RepID=A0AAV4EBY3_9GAST|nr:hypothetical protein ElyMa_005354700 [Elysia marginata]
MLRHPPPCFLEKHSLNHVATTHSNGGGNGEKKVEMDWARVKESKAVLYNAYLGMEPTELQSQREAKNDVKERNRDRDGICREHMERIGRDSTR